MCRRCRSSKSRRRTRWSRSTPWSAIKQHGRQFDSSRDPGRGEPLEFVLGTGRVIKGWDQGIVGMKVGGKRTIIIPNHLAYGSRDMGPIIKAGADLIFDVELVDVK
jgi:FKBP-type peptidyl-prolyl cis-trans isomerase